MVVVEVIVVRVARRGRRKVGGSVERGVDGWWSALLMLRANILTTWGGGLIAVNGSQRRRRAGLDTLTSILMPSLLGLDVS